MIAMDYFPTRGCVVFDLGPAPRSSRDRCDRIDHVAWARPRRVTVMAFVMTTLCAKKAPQYTITS